MPPSAAAAAGLKTSGSRTAPISVKHQDEKKRKQKCTQNTKKDKLFCSVQCCCGVYPPATLLFYFIFLIKKHTDGRHHQCCRKRARCPEHNRATSFSLSSHKTKKTPTISFIFPRPHTTSANRKHPRVYSTPTALRHRAGKLPSLCSICHTVVVCHLQQQQQLQRHRVCHTPQQPPPPPPRPDKNELAKFCFHTTPSSGQRPCHRATLQ